MRGGEEFRASGNAHTCGQTRARCAQAEAAATAASRLARDDSIQARLAAHAARSITSLVCPFRRQMTAPAVMLRTETFLSLPPTASRESPSCSALREVLDSQQQVVSS